RRNELRSWLAPISMERRSADGVDQPSLTTFHRLRAAIGCDLRTLGRKDVPISDNRRVFQSVPSRAAGLPVRGLQPPWPRGSTVGAEAESCRATPLIEGEVASGLVHKWCHIAAAIILSQATEVA